jgi:hypothetical protein
VNVELAGEAYLDILSQPDLGEIPKVTLLDTKTEAEAVQDDENYIGRKTFSYIFQTVDEGELTIPSLEFAVFNPATGNQEIIQTKAINVKVNPADANSVLVGGGANVPAGPAGTLERGEARVLGQDVAYIDTTPLTAGAIVHRTPFYAQPWYVFAQLVPLGAALAFGILSIRRRHGTAETEATREKRGRRAAESALRDARRDIGTASRDNFYASLHHGIMSYVAGMLGRSPKGLTVDEAADQLCARGSSPESCDRMRQLLLRLDAIRYSPAPDTPEDRTRLVDEVEELLVRLQDKEARAA